ncbi:MAG: hypothetical protein ACD_17C00182G0002 [uncultured bacterium]|nr:MAG: hypothetical protein ACD_17C00182G0002 [uncultured bacterium]
MGFLAALIKRLTDAVKNLFTWIASYLFVKTQVPVTQKTV